jgi:hypothetical protein
MLVVTNPEISIFMVPLCLQGNSRSALLRMMALCFLLAAPTVFISGAEICKTVDRDGNVTFSDCKSGAADSARVEVDKGPTEAEVLEAKEQAKKEMEDFNRITEHSDAPSDSPDAPAPAATEESREYSSGTKTKMSRKQHEAHQVALDEKCQTAREKILSVERARFVEECVQGRSRSTREECERFYADHGNATAVRAPLYMDLPECIEAHEFRQTRSR